VPYHTRTVLTVLFALLSLATARAQTSTWRIEGEATWWWEASIDQGVSWTWSMLEVPQDQGTVRVRASCAFPPGRAHYFAGAMIDQVITGLDGAGMSDTVTVVDPGFTNPQTLMARRFGSVLKIDEESDTLPPGEGPSHWGIFQPGHAVGAYTYANPVLGVIEFDLHLDGTPGDRLINAWWRDWTAWFPDIPDMGPAFLMLNRDFVDYGFIYPDLTVHDLTIRVVPSPGIPAIALIATPLVARRRRA
jgi:hypothetical protein